MIENPSFGSYEILSCHSYRLRVALHHNGRVGRVLRVGLVRGTRLGCLEEMKESKDKEAVGEIKGRCEGVLL